MIYSKKMHICDIDDRTTWQQCEACQENRQRFDAVFDTIGLLAVALCVGCVILLSAVLD